ncbi:excinuclease ABC subunit C [Methanolinea mesophila]|uniref:excinuclease ABC subunit UvrC n=1 Tax=Methanolinea mesophila TaxID=547055 RepID=UPI001AE9BA29|nr:excinuclease ABC subunit UvrC [Methanolinea mesophila]MBP1927941.1 excinuclease ABC subunit C [Methanolinea mesophila]
MIEYSTLPAEPGCYLFKDKNGAIIYVGKAKNLKKRVASYFQKRDHDKKTRKMLSLAESLDYLVTANEVEALILENSLIKTNHPRFNINLRDAKQYAYIQFTDDPFPRVCIARRSEGKGQFFGPFVSAAERDYVLSVVKRIFRLRTCKRLTGRACLRYHIHTCSAPCRGMIDQDAYREQVKRASMVLKGRSRDLIGELRQEMAACAESQDYERAMVLRDQTQAIERLSGKQDMARQVQGDEDIIHYLAHAGNIYLMLFQVHHGTLINKKEYIFEETPDMLEEFLVQYYGENPVPSDLILPSEVDATLEEYLAVQRGKKVTITVPKIGAKKRLLDLVEKNIEISFFGDRIKLEELQEKLALDTLPEVIECFDISHISGTAVAGSMVQFRNGKPDKRNYRRFRIKTVEGIDDFSAIAEVVKRRYSRLKKEHGTLPDLVVIDGGKGQLSAARKELKALDLPLPIIGLAKKEEQVFVPGHSHPLSLEKKEKASLFLQEIRDEAHRFAISYHHLLRRKEVRQ